MQTRANIHTYIFIRGCFAQRGPPPLDGKHSPIIAREQFLSSLERRRRISQSWKTMHRFDSLAVFKSFCGGEEVEIIALLTLSRYSFPANVVYRLKGIEISRESVIRTVHREAMRKLG